MKNLIFVFALSVLPVFSNGQTDTTFGYDCKGLDTLETWQGVRYCVIKSNPDGLVPAKGDLLKVHYRGYLENGVVFDSSFRAVGPFSFHLDKYEVIRGWDIVFGYLKEGEKARVFIPYKFAYGKQGRPPIIPRKADLIFDVELIQVDKK